MTKPRRPWTLLLLLLVVTSASSAACGDEEVAPDDVADSSTETRDDAISDDGLDGGADADADGDAEVDTAADETPDVLDAPETADEGGEDTPEDLPEATDDAGETTSDPCPADVAGIVVDVSVDQLDAHLAAGDLLAVVDVREPGETASGVIAGALLYPYTSGVLASGHGELPTDRPLYVICASGGRSPRASAFLVENGHRCVNNVLGGMSAWRAAGYPTVLP